MRFKQGDHIHWVDNRGQLIDGFVKTVIKPSSFNCRTHDPAYIVQVDSVELIVAPEDAYDNVEACLAGARLKIENEQFHLRAKSANLAAALVLVERQINEAKAS